MHYFDDFDGPFEEEDLAFSENKEDDDFLGAVNWKKSDQDFESFEEIEGDILNQYMKENDTRQKASRTVRWHLNNVADTMPKVTEETLALRQ